MAQTKPSKKPAKPYPGFPLTAHPNGQWCKKIRGRVHFFGVWADPMAALGHYNRQAADLHAGRVLDCSKNGSAQARIGERRKFWLVKALEKKTRESTRIRLQLSEAGLCLWRARKYSRTWWGFGRCRSVQHAFTAGLIPVPGSVCRLTSRELQFARPQLRTGRRIGHDPIGMNKLEPVLRAFGARLSGSADCGHGATLGSHMADPPSMCGCTTC